MRSGAFLNGTGPIEEGETMSALSRRSFVGVLAAVAAAATAP